ncbi:MAG: DUF2066 domain-containing protein [Steroidobacteraceae bacterium]|nr:DUF2066 domain-containing protein [Steroidobacteraceae bacterium]MDW8260029.1 DUF2066 domain-containing protein [Gammaproteobacteria bacterium]
MLAMPDAALAAREVRVYEVTVNESAESAAQLSAALRTALIRATGETDVAADPQLADVVANPRRYLQLLRPVAGGTQIVFDGAALDRALLAAGRTLWPRTRPVVLVLLDGIELRTRVERVAEQRGLPVIVQALGADGGASDPLATARRAGADYALSVSSAGDAYTFQLSTPPGAAGLARRWSGSLEAGIDALADMLAQHSTHLLALPDLETIVEVSGLESLRDYAEVTRLIGALPGVKSAQLAVLGRDRASWRLIARGGEDAVEGALAADTRFTIMERSGGRLAVRYRR